MSDEAYTYHLWHIHAFTIGNAETAQINVTPGESSTLKNPSKEFVTDVLRDARVEAEPVAWEVIEYRSSYQGLHPSSRWEDGWPINWRLRVTFNTRPNIPTYEDEVVGTMAQTIETSIGPTDETQPRPSVVIADFDTPAAAAAAEKAIRELAPDAEFHSFALGKELTQMQCNVGTFSAAQFEQGIPLVNEIVSACEKAGGITTFQERIEEWGEVVNGELK